jgi:hypothetical protein
MKNFSLDVKQQSHTHFTMCMQVTKIHLVFIVTDHGLMLVSQTSILKIDFLSSIACIFDCSNTLDILIQVEVVLP